MGVNQRQLTPRRKLK